MARRLAQGYNGSHGPWLQWVPWPMVTMGPMAHGYNGSHGPWLQWAAWRENVFAFCVIYKLLGLRATVVPGIQGNHGPGTQGNHGPWDPL